VSIIVFLVKADIGRGTKGVQQLAAHMRIAVLECVVLVGAKRHAAGRELHEDGEEEAKSDAEEERDDIRPPEVIDVMRSEREMRCKRKTFG
jgi:hypothetical protein